MIWTYHKFWHICCCWWSKFVSHELGLLARLLSVVESAFVCDGNDMWFVDMVDGLSGSALLACCKKSVSILKTAVWLFSCCSKSVVIGIVFVFLLLLMLYVWFDLLKELNPVKCLVYSNTIRVYAFYSALKSAYVDRRLRLFVCCFSLLQFFDGSCLYLFAIVVNVLYSLCFGWLFFL